MMGHYKKVLHGMMELVRCMMNSLERAEMFQVIR